MTEEPVVAALDGNVPAPTGIASIDSVLDLVAGLDARPLEEHADVFETAHSELRRALDDPELGAAEASPAQSA
ncbi:hypothetical protein F0U44_20490 [Nocardioides humilatus]|uniref:Uncharacterized protein n=1 Tax=Nocardioides humilatus TaxID=2607660 RepID=A0A5B1L662_9ACTN|nr:hypothetical protein [Nocardioides humilatus]KAA1416005.1 hypothetical protein F0U44_20490 [Nocardioides humilatus]